MGRAITNPAIEARLPRTLNVWKAARRSVGTDGFLNVLFGMLAVSVRKNESTVLSTIDLVIDNFEPLKPQLGGRFCLFYVPMNCSD